MASAPQDAAVRRNLSDYTKGRDNNFTLVRFIAATLVLVTHSFALSTGNAETEPLRNSLGITLGTVAVDVFFVTSGFLVTGSLLSRRSIRDFIAARILRIYPALWIATAATVIVVGLFFSTEPLGTYVTAPETWKYIIRNALLYRSSADTLPGAFTDVPWRGAVNGSLWTLPFEIRMYFALGGLWLTGKFLKLDQTRFLSICCIGLGASGLILGLVLVPSGRNNPYVTLGAMFFIGASLQILQKAVRVQTIFVIVAALALIASAGINRLAFGMIYRITIPYLVIYLAFVPGGLIRRFNALGDYSYGIYIYAFPVQQALVHFWPGISPYQLMAVSLIVTVTLAALSWHLIESRALKFKELLIPRRGGQSRASVQSSQEAEQPAAPR